jgi:hypothetical protein
MLINQSQVKDLVVFTLDKARLATAAGKVCFIKEVNGWYIGEASAEADDGYRHVSTAQPGIMWHRVDKSETFKGGWSPSASYTANQYVIHDNKFYRSTEDILPGTEPGNSAKWVLVAGSTAFKTFDETKAFSAGTHFMELGDVYLLKEDYSPLPSPVDFGTLVADGKLLKLDSGGTGAGIATWLETDSYTQNQTVTHMGGFFAANSDIPAGTAFAIHSSDANTWRPMSGGVWNTTSDAGEAIVSVTGTNQTKVSHSNGAAALLMDSNKLRLFNNNKEVFVADTFSGTVLKSPSGTASEIQLADNFINIRNASNRPVVTIDSSKIVLEGPTASKTELEIRDLHFRFRSPNASDVAVPRMEISKTETYMRGPASTNNHLFTMSSTGDTKISSRGLDILNATNLGTMLAFNTANTLELSNGVVKIKADNKAKLEVTTSDSALRSGAATDTEFKLTGDTAADLKVNGIQKIKISSSGAAQYGANTSNKFWSDTSTLGLMCRGTSVFEVGGTNNEGLYLASPSAAASQGRLVLGPSVIQGMIGDTDKVLITDTRSDFKFNGTNYLNVQNGRMFGYVNGDLRWEIDTASNFARYGWNNNTCFNATPNYVQFLLNDVDRGGATATESYIMFNSNNYATVKDNVFAVRTGSVDKIYLTAAESRMLFNSNNYVEATTSGVYVSSGGNIRIWANDGASLMRSPNLSRRIEANDSWAGMQYDSARLFRIGENGFYAQRDSQNYFFHNGNFVVGVSNTTRMDIGAANTKFTTNVEPTANNTYSLGSASMRWSKIFLTNNPDVSSDRTLKENPESLPDALLNAWGIHVSPKQYNWIDKSITDKKCIGFIAQDIIAAFDAAGLDWRTYGIISGDGEEVKFGVSYTDAHIIETAYQRRKIAHLEDLIQKLQR